MSAYIIHIGRDLKEAFNYRRSLNADSVHALGEYAKATYGEHAVLRHMTPDEESEFTRTGDLSNHPRWAGKSSSLMTDVSGRRSQKDGAKGPCLKSLTGNGVSTIRVSRWVEHALISVEVRLIPPANAGGTDLIATRPRLLRQSCAKV